MKRLTLKLVIVAAIGAFGAASYAAPVQVQVTNTPLPVTVTNPSSVGANVTITNPAGNPVKVDAALQRTPIDVQLDVPDCTSPPSCIPLQFATLFRATSTW